MRGTGSHSGHPISLSIKPGVSCCERLSIHGSLYRAAIYSGGKDLYGIVCAREEIHQGGAVFLNLFLR